MQISYNWGRSAGAPHLFALGGGDWEITWSPTTIHPYAAQWLDWARQMGPAGRNAPPMDLWAYSLQTRDLND